MTRERLRAALLAFARAEAAPATGLRPLLRGPEVGAAAAEALGALRAEGAGRAATRLAAALAACGVIPAGDVSGVAGGPAEGPAEGPRRGSDAQGGQAGDQAGRSGAPERDAGDAEVALAEADALSARGMQDAAAALLSAALARHPEHGEMRRQLAMLEAWRGRGGAAIALLRAAPKPEAADLRALELLARQLVAGGESEAALAALRHALAMDPSAARAAALLETGLKLAGKAGAEGLSWLLEAAELAGEALGAEAFRALLEACEAAEDWRGAARLGRVAAALPPGAWTALVGAAEAGGAETAGERLTAAGFAGASEAETASVRLSRAERARAAQAGGAVARGVRLTTAGLARAAAGRDLSARLAFALAALAAPEDPAARLNAGFAALGADDAREAMAHFAAVRASGADVMARVAWPRIGGRPWPQAKLPAGMFDAVLPAGAAWPEIALVTPSLNQGAFIEETILSVAHQGYPRLRHLVVDGESTDDTPAILARHRARFAEVIVGRDSGQTEALNKGFARAGGDILGWLNADDLLAPGALHMVALEWLKSGADLLQGHCLAFRGQALQRAHVPAARPEEFTPAALADIFGRWLPGDFFYQPEVFFTRALLERVGPLNEALRYTMDYEFWLRCAAAGARPARIEAPLALFRLHAAQKTADRRATLLEQARVRDGFAPPGPSAERAAMLRGKVAAALARRPLRLAVQMPGALLTAALARDVAAALAPAEVLLAGLTAPLPEADLVLRILLPGDGGARPRGAAPLVCWAWGDLRDPDAARGAAAAADVVVPAHAAAAPVLRGDALLAEAVPPCLLRWPVPALEDAPRLGGIAERYLRHRLAEGRTELVARWIAEGVAGLSLVSPGEAVPVTPEAALARRLRHKAALVLPVGGEVPQALFEALAAGQVPVLPAGCDVSAVFDAGEEAALPIVRLDADVRGAIASAEAAFDAGGPEGARRRQRAVVEAHGLEARLRRVLAALGAA